MNIILFHIGITLIIFAISLAIVNSRLFRCLLFTKRIERQLKDRTFGLDREIQSLMKYIAKNRQKKPSTILLFVGPVDNKKSYIANNLSDLIEKRGGLI